MQSASGMSTVDELGNSEELQHVPRYSKFVGQASKHRIPYPLLPLVYNEAERVVSVRQGREIPHVLLYPTHALSMRRAHSITCKVVNAVGGTGFCVRAYELRARIRCLLELWAEAGEDVRAALRGFENGNGGMGEDGFSEDEQDEVSERYGFEFRFYSDRQFRYVINEYSQNAT